MKRRITKIKVKKGVYFFGWEIYQDATRNWDEHTLTCKDRPCDAFFLAIKNMVRHVMDICEFPKEEDGKKFIVSGITESYTEDNRFLTITAQKELSFSRAPLIVNTPARAEEVGADEDPAFCLSEDLLVDLGTLLITSDNLYLSEVISIDIHLYNVKNNPSISFYLCYP